MAWTRRRTASSGRVSVLRICRIRCDNSGVVLKLFIANRVSNLTSLIANALTVDPASQGQALWKGNLSLTPDHPEHIFTLCSFWTTGEVCQGSGIGYRASGIGVGCGKCGRERKEGTRKNVYFCFGNFAIRIKVVKGIHVYFCIPDRKGRSWKIKGLEEKMSTFVYFCIPFMSGGGGFRVESMD